MTKDRAGILAGLEMGPEGVREVRWPARAPYGDRFTVSVPEEAATALQERLVSLGIELPSPVDRADLQGQLGLDAKVLAPLRAAIARGEIAGAPSGLERRPAARFVRVHEAEKFAALIESDADRLPPRRTWRRWCPSSSGTCASVRAAASTASPWSMPSCRWARRGSRCMRCATPWACRASPARPATTSGGSGGSTSGTTGRRAPA